MKLGIRTPNVKKRIAANTTGKATRAVKKAVNPLYGKSGMGLVNDPEKAIYNKVYNKTSISVDDMVSSGNYSSEESNIYYSNPEEELTMGKILPPFIVFSILELCMIIGLITDFSFVMLIFAIPFTFLWYKLLMGFISLLKNE